MILIRILLNACLAFGLFTIVTFLPLWLIGGWQVVVFFSLFFIWVLAVMAGLALVSDAASAVTIALGYLLLLGPVVLLIYLAGPVGYETSIVTAVR